MASLERPDGEQRPALVHDLSESGALLLVRTTKVEVEDHVGLHLQSSEGGEGERVAQGVVVRVEALAPGESGPWMRRVAVRFAQPFRMRETEIENYRRRAERLGIAQ